ncbi:MAG: Polysaccharide deacetylase domain containing protein [Candidatus Magnetoglobus multicellularis str. Araruama]|uniref:Polysaccharide deacetylase domain containing protein n=1 Tax=Candidatus Magnetoglobus multicellularis str. Araruama TaxID=890399 RepID=A0A1V1PJ42_9BACT|nr:MAG: Polysaccharide deacetylase domain containing protein [Candidatus Magnetoglobus multicellularis str. Araruama]
MQCKKFVLIWTILFMFMTMAAVFADDAYYNKSYAIVVGISKYASLRWKDLPYARSDAAIIADILRHKGFEVLTLYDRNATRHAILARLEKNIAPRLSPDDRVLFYFSGHGYTKQKGDWLETFLIPYDKENIDLNDSMIYISMSDLARQSKLMAAAKHQLFIIDAPITVVDQSGADNIILTTPDYITQITQRNACQLLSAGKHKKTLTDSKGPVYSILSKLFAEALDKGQADINGDGLITCLEMWGYISPRATNLEQKPDYGTFSGHDMGEFVFYSPESIRKKIAEDKDLEIEDLTVEKKAPPIVDIQPGRLYIETVPQNARIRILNIVPPYRKGMMLSPGNYKIEVSKPGYQTKIQWITIANQDRIHETIELVSSRPYSQLYVNPEPSDARIRIMNIVPPYSHGMALQAGKYLIEVSMPGYKSVNQWITIAKGKDCIFEPVLQPSTPQFQAKSPPELSPQIQPKTHKPSSPEMDSHRLTEVPIKVAMKKTKQTKNKALQPQNDLSQRRP